jgi:hypothetical protein
MKDDVRLLRFENLIYPPTVAHIANARPNVRPHPSFAQLAVDLEEIILRPFDEKNALRAKTHHLPADFRPNASAGPGNHHPLAGQKPLQLGCIKINRLPPQQIRQFERSPLQGPGDRPNAVARKRNFALSRRKGAQDYAAE